MSSNFKSVPSAHADPVRAANLYRLAIVGAGTLVYQRRQSSPSAAAAFSADSCPRSSGSSVACAPVSVTGSTNRIAK